jgi:chromosome segregation ATPase
MDELASRPTADPRVVEALRLEVAGLAEQLAAASERETASEPSAELEALRSRMDELASRPTADSALLEQVEELRREVAGVAQRLHTAALHGDDSAPNAEIEALRSRLDELADRPTADPARIDQLVHSLEEMASVPDQIDTLRGKVDAIAAEAVGPSEAIEELRGQVAGLVEELAAASERETDSEPNAELEVLRSRIDELASRPAPDLSLVEELSQRVDEIASASRRVDDLGTRLERVEEAATAERPDEHGPRIEALSERVDALGQELAAQEGRRSKSVRKADLANMRDDLAEQIRSMEARFEKLASGARSDHESLERKVEEIASALEADAEGQREQADARVAAVEQAAEALRSDIDGLVARLDDDSRTSAALEAIEALDRRVDERLEAQSVRTDHQVRAAEEALQVGLTALGERLAETESTYIEAGDALRRSIDRLGAAMEDDAPEVDPALGDSTDTEHESEQAPEPAHPFIAFVPNGSGYSIQDLNGIAPVVGERIAVPDWAGEFVVTRIGPSPLPRDRRPCAYLELRPGVSAGVDRVP